MNMPSRLGRTSYVAQEGSLPSIERRPRRAVAATAATALTLMLGIGDAGAATMTFGSPLAVPASKDTANDLNYRGTDVQLPGSVFHIPHDGADGALWNVQ